MPRTRTSAEALAGQLILAIQREWHAEAGEDIAQGSEAVMGRAHVLLQAAKANDLTTALGERSVEEYLGSAWLSAHHAALPAVRAFAAAIANSGRTTK